MRIRNPRPNSRPLALDGLLDCRLAVLGLDLDTIERRVGKTAEVIKRRCKDCGYRTTCELDLKRDPNDPVWETYCPNTATLVALVQ